MKKIDPSIPVIILFGMFLFTSFVSLATVYPPQKAGSSAQDISNEDVLQSNENAGFSTNNDGGQDLESYGRPVVQGDSTINYDEMTNDETVVESSVENKSANVIINNENPVLSDNPASTLNTQSSLASAIIQEVNRIRTSLGLSVLSYSQPATNMAVSRCEDMAKAGSLLDHSNLQTRQEYFGVLPPATTAAENLAYFSSSSAPYVVSKWMESSIHHDNIVNPNFAKVGAGVVERDGLFYYALELSN